MNKSKSRKMKPTETEVKFLEIDKKAITAKLRGLGAKDLGEHLLEEMIIYDKDLKWLDERKLIRVRKCGQKTVLSYKHHNAMDRGEAVEIELEVGDYDSAVSLFEEIGFWAYRRQQKYRHTFRLGDVTFDIDTWPRIPTYVEIEGPSLEIIRKNAEALGFQWSKVIFKDARFVIEEIYKIPVGVMRWFTFDKFE